MSEEDQDTGSSLRSKYALSDLAKMDLKIEISMLKLVYTENFMRFGDSGGELRHFENFGFPKSIHNLLEKQKFSNLTL